MGSSYSNASHTMIFELPAMNQLVFSKSTCLTGRNRPLGAMAHMACETVLQAGSIMYKK
jgi:hypothetical protein